jgi:hypothetical protein
MGVISETEHLGTQTKDFSPTVVCTCRHSIISPCAIIIQRKSPESGLSLHHWLAGKSLADQADLSVGKMPPAFLTLCDKKGYDSAAFPKSLA